jgi:hypothetical protein
VKFLKFFCLSAILILFTAHAAVASFFDQFVDPEDGKFDMSEYLASQTGFFPVPIVISDPAVGYGGGLAIGYFHQTAKDEQQTEDGSDRQEIPPTVSFVAGAYTESDSWLVGGGHMASWKSDTIRYLGVAGYGDFNLKFYGVESGTKPDDLAFKFNIQGFFLLQEFIHRVKQSNFFVGGRYSYLTSEVAFDIFEEVPDAPKVQFDTSTGGLGLIVKYDTRDNITSPNKGHYAKFEPMVYNEAFGGDFNYTKTKLASFSYWPISKVVLGVRLEGDFSSGDVPFYDAPFINMRGIPALRYQGEDVFVGELEGRWDVTPRWSLVGFIGSGWTADSISELNDESGKVAGGGGFRYLIARKQNMRVGLDVAKGPEDTVVYLGVGSSWN